MVRSLDLAGDGRHGDSTGMAASCAMAVERMRSTAGPFTAGTRTSTVGFAEVQGLTAASLVDMVRVAELPERAVTREPVATSALAARRENVGQRERIAAELQRHIAMRVRGRERLAVTAVAARLVATPRAADPASAHRTAVVMLVAVDTRAAADMPVAVDTAADGN